MARRRSHPRLGVVTTSWPRSALDPRGAFVAAFARWLTQYVGDVEVICVDGARPLFAAGGAPAQLLGGKPQPGAWLEAGRVSLGLLQRVRRAAARWDGAVSHWLAPSGLAVALAAPRLPHLAIAHGSDVRLLSALGLPRRTPREGDTTPRRLGAALLRALALRADLVYVAEALAVDGAPGRVVPMGIDAASLRGGDRAGTRQRLGIDGRTPVALFLGRLIEDKGLEDLVDALRQRPDWGRVLVAGEGPLRGGLERAARSLPLTLLGQVGPTLRRELLAAADLLVLPSRAEGAPLVLAEAQAVGLPILATRVGGIPESTRSCDGTPAALLVPPRDPEALAAALVALGDPTARARWAAASAALGEQRDWSVVAPRLWGTRLSRLMGLELEPQRLGPPRGQLWVDAV
jgi:glycosyltransferase involved in cell wall biosynthesis